MYIASDGGFYFSTDSGSNWTPGNTTLTTSQFDSLAVYDQSLFGGLQDQGCAFFKNTRVWMNQPVGDGGAVVVYAYGNPVQTAWYYTGGEASRYLFHERSDRQHRQPGVQFPAVGARDQVARKGAFFPRSRSTTSPTTSTSRPSRSTSRPTRSTRTEQPGPRSARYCPPSRVTRSLTSRRTTSSRRCRSETTGRSTWAPTTARFGSAPTRAPPLRRGTRSPVRGPQRRSGNSPSRPSP